MSSTYELVLAEVEVRGEATAEEISLAIGMSKSTVNKVLARLAVRGLVHWVGFRQSCARGERPRLWARKDKPRWDERLKDVEMRLRALEHRVQTMRP